jgi:hypothetical protein
VYSVDDTMANWPSLRHPFRYSFTESELVATTISASRPFLAGFLFEDSTISPSRRTPSMAASSSARWFVETGLASTVINGNVPLILRLLAIADVAPQYPLAEQALSAKTKGNDGMVRHVHRVVGTADVKERK